jgi:hypothetical protein
MMKVVPLELKAVSSGLKVILPGLENGIIEINSGSYNYRDWKR